MTTTSLSVYKRVILVYCIPTGVNDLIVYAKSINAKMSNNSRYSSLAAKLTELETAIESLFDEQGLVSAKPKSGSVSQRNVYKSSVILIIQYLGREVQKMADADLPNAEVIVTEAGFAVKKTGGNHPQVNTVTNGPEEGSIFCTAAGQGSKNWRISKDGVSFEKQNASKNTTAIFYGYPSGNYVYVQNSPVMDNAAEGEWSQVIRFRVK